MIIALLFLLLASAAQAQTAFEAVHKKKFWPDGQGVLKIGAQAIEFDPAGSDERLRWAYSDIRFLERRGPAEIVVHSYDDIAWQLGRDKHYRFVLTSGELSEPEFERIREKIPRPVSNRRFTSPADVRYEVAAKHLHAFGGCEGRLQFTEEEAFYVSDHPQHAREWRLGRDVESIWSADPYRLEIHVREAGLSPEVYRFELKEPLDRKAYRRLKLELYEARSR